MTNTVYADLPSAVKRTADKPSTKVSPFGEMRVSSGIELWIPPCLQQAARDLARIRTQGHDHCRRPHEDMGNAQNMLADYWGVAAELVLMLALEREGLSPREYVFAAAFAPEGADFVLNSTRFNVKAAPLGKSFLCLSEQQRLDPRHACDFYLLTAFSSAERLALFQPVPAAAVSRWELRKAHSEYRSVPLSALTPLANLQQIVEVTR